MNKLRGGYNGLLLVALAGPGSNIVFALVLALIGSVWHGGTEILFRAAYLSLFLALFNLLPIPPLDGSKFLLAARIPATAYIELSQLFSSCCWWSCLPPGWADGCPRPAC